MTEGRLPELYIATDVEADGPIPGPYSMISLGMAVAGRPEGTIKDTVGLAGLPHTHHAGEDAAELAAVFAAVLER